MCDQKQMEDEIEMYIKKNIEEMYNSIEELKDSLSKEAKSMEENGFPNVARKLYDEIDTEIECLKEQYEELRINGIEKIKIKYVKCL